jgi:hypothetical protein
VWLKARGASGSCAWGSFQSPANPVLRDVTERVVIASKGRFDRAVSRQRRASLGLPAEISVSKDEFIEATTDVWEIGAERATRVGHPAPFPVELPLRLIELYTYRDDLVLDPFMGSGTTGVAAVRSGRRFVGYDTETAYVEIAEQRIRAERDLRMHDSVPATVDERDYVTVARRRRRRQDGQRYRRQLLGGRRHRTEVVLRRLGRVYEHAGRPAEDRRPVEGVGQGGRSPGVASRCSLRPHHHRRPGGGQCRRSGAADTHRWATAPWTAAGLRRHRDGVGRRPGPLVHLRVQGSRHGGMRLCAR